MFDSKVSVIIPCYNGEEFINRSIDSVFVQEYDNIELIVVDDGSTDNSRELILAWEVPFSKKGFSLKYVCQENQGQAAAVSLALKYVTGKYLTLLDADDCFLPGSIRKRAEFLDSHSDYAAVRTNGWQIKGNEKKLFVTSEKEKETTDYFNALFFGGATNWAGSYMVRTDILFDFYPEKNIYPSRFGQNMQIILPVTYKRKTGFIDEPLMAYVLHENSHTQAESLDKQWEKDNRNFYGYIDIYRHMVESIICAEEERSVYEKCIDSWVKRHECDTALKNRDKQKLREEFKNLLLTGYATTNDKIKYCSVLNPAKALIYRVLRRLKTYKAR